MSTDILERRDACEYLTDIERTVGLGAGTREEVDTLSGRERSGWAREISLRDYALVIEGRGEEPNWLLPTSQSLSTLLLLPVNWDSYGARPIEPELAVEVLRLLFSIMRDDTPLPRVVPTPRGGIQLEWHTRGIDLEIEVESPGRILVSYEDQETEWEQELVSDFAPLAEAVAKLSHRR